MGALAAVVLLFGIATLFELVKQLIDVITSEDEEK